MAKEKRIPKNLSECMVEDSTASNLRSWAVNLENWGNILLFVIIVIGIISTIMDAVESSNMADFYEDMYGDGGTSIFATVVSSLITWGLYAFIEYCVFHALALLISALATITQNTVITANVALYEAEKNEAFKPMSASTNVTENGDIICPKCGTRTQAGKKACWSCGQLFEA